MRIAILGATSHIAKDLVQLFARSGSHELVLFARRPEAVTLWLAASGMPQRYPVREFTAFNGEQHFDAVINFVGVGNPAQTVAMGSSIFDITRQFDDLALAYLQREPGCRYVFASSGAAFGGDFAQPVDETTPAVVPINRLQPADWYGAAKLHAECRHRSLAPLPIVDLRIFNYFSSTEDIQARFLITDMLRAIKDREVFRTSSANITRDYAGPREIHQLVSGVLAAPPVNTAVDCYTQAPVDKLTLLAAMQSEFGLRYELVVQPTGLAATGNKVNYYSRNRKASVVFGYDPPRAALEVVLDESRKLLGLSSA